MTITALSINVSIPWTIVTCRDFVDLKRSSEVLVTDNSPKSELRDASAPLFWCLHAPLASIKGVYVGLLLVVDQTLEMMAGTDWEAKAVLAQTLKS